MKAISIRQPWAWLVVAGYKDIENRSWPTSHRGPVLVHAGLKRADKEDVEAVIMGLDRASRQELSEKLPALEVLPVGGIVGVVEIVDCVTESSSSWFEGPYGFVLRNPYPLSFVPYSGSLKLFEISPGSLPSLAGELRQCGIF